MIIALSMVDKPLKFDWSERRLGYAHKWKEDTVTKKDIHEGTATTTWHVASQFLHHLHGMVVAYSYPDGQDKKEELKQHMRDPQSPCPACRA